MEGGAVGFYDVRSCGCLQVSTPSYASNSFFVTVDDYQVPAQWELHDSTSGLDATWRVDASWDAPEFFLHAGHHAVSVFGRETGARLAAIGLPAYSACYWIDKSDGKRSHKRLVSTLPPSEASILAWVVP